MDNHSLNSLIFYFFDFYFSFLLVFIFIFYFIHSFFNLSVFKRAEILFHFDLLYDKREFTLDLVLQRIIRKVSTVCSV